jgi:O-acetylserine/cysteine efflux transporter
MMLAALTSVVWGLAFVAVKLGLDSFSAPQLTALRFLIAALPVFFVPRPRISWTLLALIGLTLFAGQFLLLFFAFTLGLAPGLASVTQQMQAFFTVGLAAAFLGDVPTRRQCAGMVAALGGLALIGSSPGDGLRPLALGLALGGAFSWAVGNVLVKRAADVPIFPLVVWASLVPPLPALAISSVADRRSLLVALLEASWASLAAAAYLGVAATILAYAAWGSLLRRYPTGAVAPFALLAPCAGVLASAAVFGEIPSPLRSIGMACIVLGLAIVAAPARRAGTA